ncbi:hypothetical protein H5410_027656 [Solanum commersonii]|uniref:NADH-ubiquinone oxidoreductase chain 3 n=1 Tax=Solanum commersonii TaxID=4109 RepID=A0A9J5Z3Z8_SOLCO|nr:hypothetical protein H5410_027656 [Solanum commersonii]
MVDHPMRRGESGVVRSCPGKGAIDTRSQVLRSGKRKDSEEDDSEREKKGNLFMAVYLHTFKNNCDSLASINAPVSQSDMSTFLLADVPSDYESFVTTAKLQRPKPTMAELRSSLLLHESWLQQMHPITMLMILYTNRVRTRPRTLPPNKIDPFGSWSMMAFLLTLPIGSFYEWKRGASDWE